MHCAKLHLHDLQTGNNTALQEQIITEKESDTTPFGTFCTSLRIHIASGQVQFIEFGPVTTGAC